MRKVIITVMIGVLGLALFYSPAQASKNDPLRPWPRVEHAVTPTEDADDGGWSDPYQVPPPTDLGERSSSHVPFGKKWLLVLDTWEIIDIVVNIGVVSKLGRNPWSATAGSRI